jgi:WG containing repeat
MAGFCPDCGTAREDGADRCSNCGHQFVTPVAVQSDEPETAYQFVPPLAVHPDEPEPRERPKWLSPKWIGIGAGAIALAGVGGWALTSGGFSLFGTGLTRSVDISLLPVSFGGKCGYVDASGKMVINPQFDNAGAFNSSLSLAPVLVGGKWGLIDREGKYVVNPQFDSAEIRSDNRTIGIIMGGKAGTADATGKFLINPQFDYLSDVDIGGRSIARVGEKFGIIDSTGKFLVSPEFDRIIADKTWNPDQPFDLSTGPLLIVRDGKFGFVDPTGKLVIQPQFSDASPFSASGYAAAAIEQADNDALNRMKQDNANAAEPIIRNGLSALLAGDIARQDGNLTFTLNNPAMTVAVDNWLSHSLPNSWTREVGSVGNFTLSQHLEAPKKSVYGFIDRTGKFVISPQFASAGQFSGAGLAYVQVGTQWGFVDTKGKVAINPQYSSVNAFTKANGQWLAVVGIPGESADKTKYGLIDATGTYKINPQFDSVQNFYPNGYAIARTGELAGMIDTSGKYLLQPVYSTLFEIPGTERFFFVKPIAGSKDAAEIGIVDASGKTITDVRGGFCPGAYSLGQ